MKTDQQITELNLWSNLIQLIKQKQKQIHLNLYTMSILNPTSVYELTRPARIDPKFIGIGEVYMEHKHKRKQVEKIYHDTKNSLLYAKKTNLNLSRSLEEKEKELQKLQQVKERHQDDHQKKMKEDEKRRIKMEQLRRKATFQRKKLKSSIQERMSSLREQRQKDKSNLKQKSSELRCQLQTSQHDRFTMRKTMYNTISSQKQSGTRKVDEFFRQRILESLNDYKYKIKQEDDKYFFYQESIEKMNQNISVVSQGNQKKHQILSKLEDKIQTLNPLKSFFSPKLSNNLNDISFSRKSSLKSISSKRPSQILLEDKLISGKKSSSRSKIISMKKKSNNLRDQNPESSDFIEV